MVRCAVLGGGISGLSIAHYLRRRFGQNIDITLVEQSGRLGGWINTINAEGRVIELGPKSLRAFGNGKEVIALSKELNIQHSLIFGDLSAKKRFLYLDGRVQEMHTGWRALTSPTILGTIVPAMLKEPFMKHEQLEDESIGSFITRRFGNDVLTSFVEPLVLGVYGGNCAKLSIRSCFPTMYEPERNGESLVMSMLFGGSKKQSDSYASDVAQTIKDAQRSGVFSFKGGLHVLVDALSNSLSSSPTSSLLLNTKATSLRLDGTHVQLGLSTGRTLDFDHVFSALPSVSLAGLLADQPQLASHLNSIPFVSIGVVSMLFTNPQVKSQIKRGFGYLIPPKEHQPILGVSFDSAFFPHHTRHADDTILSVMVGGDTSVANPSAVDVGTVTKEHIKQVALETLKQHLGITAQPHTCIVEVCYNAIPQYHVGHHKLVTSIHTLVGELFKGRLLVTGNCFGRVGVPDCIAQAQAAAEACVLR